MDYRYRLHNSRDMFSEFIMGLSLPTLIVSEVVRMTVTASSSGGPLLLPIPTLFIELDGNHFVTNGTAHLISMCFFTVSSRPCLETDPHSTLRTPFAGHCLGTLGALWGGKPCPAELSEGVNRVLRTLSGDPPLPILQTPSAGHCLDTHGSFPLFKRHVWPNLRPLAPKWPCPPPKTLGFKGKIANLTWKVL